MSRELDDVVGSGGELKGVACLGNGLDGRHTSKKGGGGFGGRRGRGRWGLGVGPHDGRRR